MAENGTAELVPLPMVFATLAFSIVGLTGNGIIILATLMSPSLRNRCNILICVLGAADFIVCAYLVRFIQFISQS